MKTDLISRSELFNRLATVPIKAESVETTTEIFKIINSMPVESVGVAESAFEQICDEYCKFPYIAASQDELERICDNCPLDNIASARIESGSDLISRADAIGAVGKYKEEHGYAYYDCACDIENDLKQLPSASAEAEQVTGKLKNPCDTLLTEDNAECKEQKSKLDLIRRQDAIEAVVCHIWHTPNEVYRQFNCENVVREVVEDAIKRIPSAETLQNLTKPNKTYEDDIIRRQDAIEAVKQAIYNHDSAIMRITSIPSASVEWIPCSERLPDEGQSVYVTVLWEGYGDYITAYGMRTRYAWRLYSGAEGELIKGYTVVAWMPLPKPYREDGE